MSHARYLVGDVFDRLAELEDGSVDLVITSPPFLALRSYLPADHPDKGREIGSEATPAEWLDTQLEVMAELRRVTADHGSVCVELGDTYAGSGGAGGDYAEGGMREGQAAFKANPGRNNGTRYAKPGRPSIPAREYQDALAKGGNGWPLAKSKALIPELFRIALAYGINPLTGTESPAGKWLVRNVVTWCRPNPPVGALGDKWRPATSDVVVACTSPRRYWDDLATRRPHSQPRSLGGVAYYGSAEKGPGNQTKSTDGGEFRLIQPNPSGAPLLDYWEIPPTGYSGAHYAVYPPALVEPLVKAMCPQRVCVACGEPSRRITESTLVTDDGLVTVQALPYVEGTRNTKGNYRPGHVRSDVSTLGWTDCGHDDYRPGIVLDPFAGSGTTLQVATGHGMDAIGIDLDERNAVLAEQRIGGLFLEVER